MQSEILGGALTGHDNPYSKYPCSQFLWAKHTVLGIGGRLVLVQCSFSEMSLSRGKLLSTFSLHWLQRELQMLSSPVEQLNSCTMCFKESSLCPSRSSRFKNKTKKNTNKQTDSCLDKSYLYITNHQQWEESMFLLDNKQHAE